MTALRLKGGGYPSGRTRADQLKPPAQRRASRAPATVTAAELVAAATDRLDRLALAIALPVAPYDELDHTVRHALLDALSAPYAALRTYERLYGKEAPR